MEELIKEIKGQNNTLEVLLRQVKHFCILMKMTSYRQDQRDEASLYFKAYKIVLKDALDDLEV